MTPMATEKAKEPTVTDTLGQTMNFRTNWQTMAVPK